MEKTFTRRALLTSAPALACAPALAAPSIEDPLVALAADYHLIHTELSQGVPDDLADQYADMSLSIENEMLRHTPITAAGAAALLSVLHHETSEGIIWSGHPRMIESMMAYLGQQ